MSTFDFAQARQTARRRTRAMHALLALAFGLVALTYTGLGALSLHVAHGVTTTPVGMPWVYGALGLFALCVVAIAARAFRREARRLRSGPDIARLLRAREATSDSDADRTLRNVSEEVAVAVGLPAPRVYLIPGQPGVNALAIGADAAHGSIFVTEEAATRLSRDALQAVVAHEMSHLASGDAALHAAVGGASAALRASVAPGIWPYKVLVGMVQDVAEDGSSDTLAIAMGTLGPLLAVALPTLVVAGGAAGLVPAILLFGGGLVVVSGVGSVLARLLDGAVSHQTEFGADALAVELTRHPAGLAEALRAVRDAPLKGILLSPHRDLLRPFFFARPDTVPPYAEGLLDSHPTPAARLVRLKTHASDERWRASAQPRPTRADRAPRQTDVSAVQIAAQALATLPQALLNAAHTPADAEALAYALLISPDAAVRHRQRAVLPDADSTFALVEQIEALPRSSHVPLAEIAIPALRALAPLDQVRLLAIAERLVRADGRASVREVALVQTLRAAFRQPSRAPQKATAETIVRLAGVVLTALAQSGSPHTAARDRAFEAGARHLARRVPGRAAPLASLTPARLGDALDTLASIDEHGQMAVLDAAVACAEADGRILGGEADLVRVLALAVGMPFPLTGGAEARILVPEAA